MHAAPKQNDFSKGSIPGTILHLSGPLVVAQIINILYSVVDRMYIGQMPEVGRLALTGIGVTMPVISIITGFANLCGMGGAPLCSIARGAGDKDRAEHIMGNSFTLLLLFAALLTAGRSSTALLVAAAIAAEAATLLAAIIAALVIPARARELDVIHDNLRDIAAAGTVLRLVAADLHAALDEHRAALVEIFLHKLSLVLPCHTGNEICRWQIRVLLLCATAHAAIHSQRKARNILTARRDTHLRVSRQTAGQNYLIHETILPNFGHNVLDSSWQLPSIGALPHLLSIVLRTNVYFNSQGVSF